MARQNLGQHFLKDKTLAKRIVSSLTPFSGDVIEIGPGKGILTEEIILNASDLSVFAIEKDKTLADDLGNKFGSGLTIVNDSILNVNINELIQKGNANIVGNIPYYISAEISDWITDQSSKISKGILLVQKEFFEKITAQPGSGKYNPRGIIFNIEFKIIKLFNIKRGSFSPPPKVISTLFLFEKNDTIVIPEILKPKFRKFLDLSFKNRRKTFLNNIQKEFGLEKSKQYLESAGCKTNIRAEEISPDIFLKIFCLIKKDQDNPVIL